MLLFTYKVANMHCAIPCTEAFAGISSAVLFAKSFFVQSLLLYLTCLLWFIYCNKNAVRWSSH